MKYLLSIFLLILCSCSSEEKTPAFYFDEKKFKSEWDIWKSQDIKNYSFTLKGALPYHHFQKLRAKSDGLIGAIPMYIYEAKITVKNGVMESVEYIGTDPPPRGPEASVIPNPNTEPEYTTISDMYQKMYDRIKMEELYLLNSTPGKGCFDITTSVRFEIEYDQKFHYITYYSSPITTYSDRCLTDNTDHAVFVSDFTIGND
jgi:hypothetical protein